MKPGEHQRPMSLLWFSLSHVIMTVHKEIGIDMTFIVLTANGGTDQKLLINKSKMGINSLIPAFAGHHLDNFY